jgi:hypothetical protein
MKAESRRQKAEMGRAEMNGKLETEMRSARSARRVTSAFCFLPSALRG